MAGRRTGVLSSAECFDVSDHACWAYRSDAERATVAVAWLADGLALGQRAVYVGDASPEALLAELASLPDRDAAWRRGALEVHAIAAFYDGSGPIDPDGQLAVYSAAVDQAIGAGYAGLRVAVDVTPLVRDPARRGSHLRWEQTADRLAAGHSLAPLCLYDRRVIADFPALDVVHPVRGPDAPPYSLHAASEERSALTGEVDALTVTPLLEVFANLPEADTTIDVSSLDFVDAHAAALLEQALHHRRASGRPLVLAGPTPLVRKVWRLCGLDETLLVD